MIKDNLKKSEHKKEKFNKIIKKNKKPTKEKIITPKSKKSNLKQEKITTGIKNFDSLIQGGFSKNSINLLVGSSGSGKSIFAIHF